MINIFPDRILSFKNNRNSIFTLIVTTEIADNIAIQESKYYKKIKKIICAPNKDVEEVIQSKVPEGSDILFIPYHYKHVKSFPKDTTVLAKKSRFLTLTCTQTPPVEISMLDNFIKNLYFSDPAYFEERIETFFQTFGDSNTILYVNPQYQTSLIVGLNENCMWTEVCGKVNHGQTALVPGGELTLTHREFRTDPIPPITTMNGEFILEGYPILHRFNLDKKTLKLQEKLYEKLKTLHLGAIKVSVKEGLITQLEVLNKQAYPAYEALNEMFAMSNEYLTVTEIGIGLNRELPLEPVVNTALNETYGGKDICVHYGIGREGLDFHLDVICPQTVIRTDLNKTFHKDKSFFDRRSGGMCPCAK